MDELTATTELDNIAEAIRRHIVTRRIGRVTLSDGSRILRVKIGRSQAVTLKRDPNEPGYVVKSLRQGMCADIYTDEQASGLDADAAVETFARFVTEALRHRA